MQIRHYLENDLDAVARSWEAATRLAHPFMTEEFIAQERINLADIYMPRSDTWVVDIDSKVEGFIALTDNEVGALFINPKFHGMGLGTALMNKAKELHGDLEVEVFKANTLGRQFYRKYGFEFLEEKPHDATGQNLLRLKFTADQGS